MTAYEDAIERTAAVVHEAWMAAKAAQGGASRRSETGEELMVPYRLLSCRTNVLRGEGPPAQNARRTHCPKGHEYTSENTRMIATARQAPYRECITCARVRDARGHRDRYWRQRLTKETDSDG